MIQITTQITVIAIAGALGAVSRYGLSLLAYSVLGSGFPYGTFIVNIIGCFLIGFAMHISIATDAISDTWRLAITTGFLGALTTFSTFSYETMQQISEGTWLLAAGNITANIIFSLLATFGGLALARLIVGGS